MKGSVGMKFKTAYDQYKNKDGQSCVILRELTNEERDPEVGTMYRIRLEDGTEIDAWSDELEA